MWPLSGAMCREVANQSEVRGDVRVQVASLAFLAGVLAASAAAAAEEVCVACSGPGAIYRCQVDVGNLGVSAKLVSKFAQYACAREMARQGRHESCSVQRESAGTCSGEVRVITAASLSAPAPAPATETASGPGSTPPAADQPPSETAAAPGKEQAAAAPGTGAASKPAPEEQKPGPPKTMAELVERAGKQSKKDLDKTGEAIGGTMKKTWQCVTSLFQQC